MSSISTSETPRTGRDALAEHEVRKHLPRNFLAHGLDGGLFIGGMAFLSGAVVAPKMMQSLGGPTWLTAAMPQILAAGAMIPPLLTAPWIERLVRIRPLLLTLGVFQRLPYLIVGLLLLLWGAGCPAGLLVAAVALCPLLSGLFAGSGHTAWQEFVANAIPPHRRSSVWATRNVISSVIGLAAGGAVLSVLDRFPGSRGYGVLHLITFAFLVASYIAFTFTREIPNPRSRPHRSAGLGEVLADIPGILHADKRFRLYLLSRGFQVGMLIMIPFMSIFALERLGWADSKLGVLVLGQMAGAITGNLLAAWVGDRWGGKRVLLISKGACLGVCLAMPWAQTPAAFFALFFLFGAGHFCNQVGNLTLAVELCHLDRRIRYLAAVSGTALISMAVTWALSTLLWQVSGGNFITVALAGAAAVAVSSLLLTFVQEPRSQRSTEAPTQSTTR